MLAARHSVEHFWYSVRHSPGVNQADGRTLLAIATIVDLLRFFAREPPDKDVESYWGEFTDQMRLFFQNADSMDPAETEHTLLAIRDWAKFEIPVSLLRCLGRNNLLMKE